MDARFSRRSARGALEAHFARISRLLYDTRVGPDVLDREVMPSIADDVTFTDPWQSDSGRAAYRLGLDGFHRLFRFHFEAAQVSVQLDPDARSGRAMVDGVMQLEALAPLYTFPLRTMLVYRFSLDADGAPKIHAHEEHWSVGDLIAALPLVGRLYASGFRRLFARGFLGVSGLARRLSGDGRRPGAGDAATAGDRR